LGVFFCNFVLDFINLWLFVIFFEFNFFVGSYMLVESVARLNFFFLCILFFFFFPPVVAPAQGLAGLTPGPALAVSY
jgi:hypothetical protein